MTQSIVRWVLLTLCLFLAITHREFLEQATSTHHIFHDTDDAMRLVQVRDWLAGQSWWDLHQYRLYPKDPIIMHWSRLVDVPIAGLILLFKPMVGQFHAEIITRILWPLILFGVFILFYFKLCVKLAGQGILLYAATLLLVNVYVTAQFVPGRIDHHSVQLVCLMAGLWLAFGAEQTRRNALILGAVLALMLTIGFETVPLVLVLGVVIVLRWVGDAAREFMQSTGVGLVVGLYGLYLATHPLGEFWQSHCDAIAMPGLLLFGSAGIVMLALGYVYSDDWRLRLMAAGLGGAAAFVVFAIGAPQCLGNPYEAVNPLLKTEWLANVQEAQPLLRALALTPESTIPLVLYGVMGLIVSGILIRRPGPARGLALLYCAACATTIWQIRGGFFMVSLAMPLICMAIAQCASIFKAETAQSLGRIAILLPCVPFLSSFFYEAFASNHQKLTTQHAACMDQKALDVLKNLPAGLVFAPMDIGPNILANTTHSVVSAPYHRNNQGNLFGLEMKALSVDALSQSMKLHKIDYAYLCKVDGMNIDAAISKTGAELSIIYSEKNILLIRRQ